MIRWPLILLSLGANWPLWKNSNFLPCLTSDKFGFISGQGLGIRIRISRSLGQHIQELIVGYGQCLLNPLHPEQHWSLSWWFWNHSPKPNLGCPLGIPGLCLTENSSSTFFRSGLFVLIFIKMVSLRHLWTYLRHYCAGSGVLSDVKATYQLTPCYSLKLCHINVQISWRVIYLIVIPVTEVTILLFTISNVLFWPVYKYEQ